MRFFGGQGRNRTTDMRIFSPVQSLKQSKALIAQAG